MDTVIIIGGRSRLTQAVVNEFSEDYNLVLPERQTYSDWSAGSGQEKIDAFFSNYDLNKSIVLITSGILDSKAQEEQINAVNFDLPRNIIESLKGKGAMIITCGTIMERLENTTNPYVRSKIKLASYLKALDQSEQDWMHIRLHTLYGYKEPSPFMFLGLIYNSLNNRTVFEMTSGLQYREYHHFDDVARALRTLIKSDQKGIQEITAGNGIRLRDLASRIYAHFQREELLVVGAVEIEHQEKFTNDYVRNPNLDQVEFRDPVRGVTDYLAPLLSPKSIEHKSEKLN